MRTHPDPELKRDVATRAIGGDLSQSARLLMDRGHTAEEARSIHENHTKEIEEWAREEYYGSSHNSENRQRWKQILEDIRERRKKIEEFDWDNIDEEE